MSSESSNQVNLSRDILLQYLYPSVISPTPTEQTNPLYLNIHTGQLATNQSNIMDWKIVHVKKQDTHLVITFDDNSLQMSPEVKFHIDKVLEAVSTVKTLNLNIPSKKNETAIFTEIEQRFQSPKPLSENEIKQLYQELFLGKHKELANEKRKDLNHFCSIVYDLYQSVKALEELPREEVMQKIGGPGGSGVNGAYFIKNKEGEILWVYKPASEEKKGIFVGIEAGKGAKREHLAHLLNRENTYTIPYTVYAILEGNEGSLQRFIPQTQSVHVTGLGVNREESLKRLLKKDIQASLLFDLRFNNSDRHLGNLLTPQEGTRHPVYMIDQGACMSSSPDDLLKLEQLNLPQVLEDWDEGLIDHLFSFKASINQEVVLMAEHGISQSSIAWMIRATNLLIESIQLSQNSSKTEGISITPYDIGVLFEEEQDKIWNSSNCSSQLDFLKDVLKEKEVVKNLSYTSRAKILLARRNYAKTQPNLDRVNLLYGSDQNDSSEDRIDFSDSIIGKFLIKKK